MARHMSRPRTTYTQPPKRKKQPEPEPVEEEEDLPLDEEPDEPHPAPLDPGEVKEPEQPPARQTKPPAWSNDPRPADVVQVHLPGSVPHDIDTEMRTPTSREQRLADLAKKNTSAPQQYDIKNKNERAMRVIYDHNGHSVAVQPGRSKEKIWLLPRTADQLNRGDLEIKPSMQT
jgi:hypothetical protein